MRPKEIKNLLSVLVARALTMKNPVLRLVLLNTKNAVVVDGYGHIHYLNPVAEATFGHPQGDELLTRLSRRVQEKIREEDVAVRYGGLVR